MLCAKKIGLLSTKLSCGHGNYSPLLVGSYKSKSLLPSPTPLSQSHIHINIGLDVCHQTGCSSETLKSMWGLLILGLQGLHAVSVKAARGEQMGWRRKKWVLAELCEEGKEMVVLPEDGMKNRTYHEHKLGKGHTTYSPLSQVGLQQYLQWSEIVVFFFEACLSWPTCAILYGYYLKDKISHTTELL